MGTLIVAIGLIGLGIIFPPLFLVYLVVWGISLIGRRGWRKPRSVQDWAEIIKRADKSN